MGGGAARLSIVAPSALRYLQNANKKKISEKLPNTFKYI